MKNINSRETRLRDKKYLSLKALIIVYTLAIMIPMFLSVIYVSHELDKTSQFSMSLNNRILQQTKSMRLVLQRTADVERKARLFMVLSDPAQGKTYELESYETTRASLKQELNELLQSAIDNKLTLLINELSEKESMIYKLILSAERHGSEKLIDSAFLGLRESSNVLAREFESFVDQQSKLVLQQSQSMVWLLLAQGGVLLLIALLCIGALLKAISTPMRHLHEAIQVMLTGDFDRPIRVHGSAELCRLGKSLESLRIYLRNTARAQGDVQNNSKS